MVQNKILNNFSSSILDFIKLLLDNKVLTSALFSWILAQFLKIIIEILSKRKKFRAKELIFRALFGTGGMPSSHSATVTAVAVSIGFQDGFNSSIFAFAVVLLIIVIRDATGVRQSAGKQAEAINKILSLQNKKNKTFHDKVKEVRGHTPLETFIGVIVGILVSLGMYLID